jgi:predicted DsbA family dithiol-disulfide isomerase
MAEDSTVTANSKPGVGDVWHDLVCPWCRIGCHQLLAAADRFSAESGGRSVSIRYQPFLLEPSTPPEGYDLRARLASKYGAARLDQMFAMVTQRGAAIGLHFDFAKIRTSPSTVAGHALLGAASPSQQRPLLEALHQAYFERGENLGDLKVLTEAALVAQMDPGHVADVFADKALHDQIRASAQAASRSGIDGVPHFRFGTKVLHGAQPVEALLAAMRG